MRKPAVRNLRVAALIAMLIVYVGHQRGVVEAAPIVTAPTATEWCANICDEAVSCSEPCLVVVGQEPAMEVTYGQFDGGPSNDWCNGDGCADECSWWSVAGDVCWWEDQETTCGGYGLYGYCGDNACSSAQGETCGNCEEDCSVCEPPGTCPNDYCDAGETFRSCPLDCEEPENDWCGNDICGPEENGTSCAEDCTLLIDWCSGSFPCADGWECIDNVCVWEIYPELECCGGAAQICLHGPLDCPVGTSCRETVLGVNDFMVCKPNLGGG